MFGFPSKKKEKRPFIDPLYSKRGTQLLQNAAHAKALRRWEMGLPGFSEINQWFKDLQEVDRNDIISKLPKFPSWWLKCAFERKERLPMILSALLLAPAFPLMAFYFINRMDDNKMLATFGWWPIVIMVMALLAWRLLVYSEQAASAGWCVYDPLSAKMIENIYLLAHGPEKDLPRPSSEDDYMIVSDTPRPEENEESSQT